MTAGRSWPFPSSPQSLFQDEFTCEISVFIHIEIRTNYHKIAINFALRFALKETLRGTRKWSIHFPVKMYSLPAMKQLVRRNS